MNPMMMKSKILKEIMNVMDNEEGNKLKNHPKLLAAKVTVSKPMEKSEEVPSIEGESEESPEMESSEGPESISDLLSDVMEVKGLPPELKKKLSKFI